MIHVTSAWSEAYQPLADLTWNSNKVHYAKKHGYKARHYIHPPAEAGDISWNRVELFLDTLENIEEGDFLFWTGCDALITNPRIPCEYFLKENLDFYFAIDNYSWAPFADVFLMKSCAATKHMLRAMLDGSRRKNGGNEQDAFAEYLFQGRCEEYTKELYPHREIPGIYAKAESLLNQTPVKVRVLTPMDNFCGDGHSHWGTGQLAPNAAWQINCLVFHQGGKDLAYRLHHLPQYNPFPEIP